MKIQSVFKMIVGVFLCAVVSFSAQAKDKPFQAQLMLSSLGPGVNLGYHVNDMIFLGVDFATISWSDEFTDDGEGEIKVDGSFTTQVLMARVSPFENGFFGDFFFQAGLVNRDWKIEGDGSAEIGNSGYEAKAKATVEFPSIGLNLGVGWNWISDFGLSGGLGVGMITGGKPEADVETINEVPGMNFTMDNVKEEEEELEDEMAQFANMPYVHLTIGWNF